MNQAKYIGVDAHQATISVAVMDSAGKLILESILETKAATILQFLGGLRGSLLVTFEEGTSATWLYDLLEPRRPPISDGPGHRPTIDECDAAPDKAGRLAS